MASMRFHEGRKSLLPRRVAAVLSRCRMAGSTKPSRSEDTNLIHSFSRTCIDKRHTKHANGVGAALTIRHRIRAEVPLEQDAQLPLGAKRADDFIIDSGPRDIAEFRGHQIRRTSSLISDLWPHQKRWDAPIGPAIKPASGKIRKLAFGRLSAQCGPGGGRWMGQFSAGFPTTWLRSQKGAFDVPHPPDTALDQAMLFEAAEARFRERSAKSGAENAPRLRTEALGKAEKVWLFPPVALAGSGCPDFFQPGCYNVAFRRGVDQAAKLRACDDLRRSLANSACSALTPAQLVSRGRMSQISHRRCGAGRDWALFKADNEASGKQLPLEPLGQARAEIAPNLPKSGRRFGCASRTLAYGATADALHCKVAARPVTSMERQLLGIPMIW